MVPWTGILVYHRRRLQGSSELAEPLSIKGIFMVLDKLNSSHEVGHAFKAELEFKASARRNKLLGYWLADKMGLGEAQAEEYARQVVRSDLDEPGEEDRVRKVMSDIQEKGLDVTEDLLRQEMERLLRVARGQIEDETQ